MFYYYHAYMVSSGKDHKLIEKIYTDPAVAQENLLLMGGIMKKLKEVGSGEGE